MKNLEEVTIRLCDNGFLVEYSFENEYDRYENKKLVFNNRSDMLNLLNSLIDAKETNGNTGI